jgi:hypothetical protein
MSQVTVWLKAGTYYVLVKSADTSTGDYTIRAWQPDNIKLTVNGSTLTGYISSSDDVDWYRFTISSPGVYSIQTEAEDLEYGCMELYSSSFAKIALNGSGIGFGTNDMPAITASLAAGTYILRVLGATSDDTGTYTIRAFSGSISGGVVSLMINGPGTGGSIADASDADWYQFIVTREDSYTIQMTAGTMTEGYLTLRDEDLSVLDYCSSGDTGKIPAIKDVTLEPGTYYLGFSSYLYTDSGTYKIQVKD